MHSVVLVIPFPQLSKVGWGGGQCQQAYIDYTFDHFSLLQESVFPTSRMGAKQEEASPPIHQCLHIESLLLGLFSALKVFIPKTIDRKKDGWFLKAERGGRCRLQREFKGTGEGKVKKLLHNTAYFSWQCLDNYQHWGQGRTRQRPQNSILEVCYICVNYTLKLCHDVFSPNHILRKLWEFKGEYIKAYKLSSFDETFQGETVWQPSAVFAATQHLTGQPHFLEGIPSLFILPPTRGQELLTSQPGHST